MKVELGKEMLLRVVPFKRIESVKGISCEVHPAGLEDSIYWERMIVPEDKLIELGGE